MQHRNSLIYPLLLAASSVIAAMVSGPIQRLCAETYGGTPSGNLAPIGGVLNFERTRGEKIQSRTINKLADLENNTTSTSTYFTVDYLEEELTPKFFNSESESRSFDQFIATYGWDYTRSSNVWGHALSVGGARGVNEGTSLGDIKSDELHLGYNFYFASVVKNYVFYLGYLGASAYNFDLQQNFKGEKFRDTALAIGGALGGELGLHLPFDNFGFDYIFQPSFASSFSQIGFLEISSGNNVENRAVKLREDRLKLTWIKPLYINEFYVAPRIGYVRLSSERSDSIYDKLEYDADEIHLGLDFKKNDFSAMMQWTGSLKRDEVKRDQITLGFYIYGD